DVRFTSDRFVETTGVERRVSLKGVEYPVTLAAGGKAVRIVDAFGGAHVKETLRPGETLTIADETIDELVIKEWTIPEEFALHQNFPNPFNPTTTLRFDLPIDGMVKLEVYDILGQKVETLFDGELEAGVHDLKWNAIDYASGVYIYRIEATDFSAVKKMVLMK
ncbi:MAG: T9SS type A sorting domain-containing protein, partial [Ignavibacteriales bacterium]|nr:T9SS type A sorting domain-containing protein [Ignavibacteriales bacterium]